MTCPFCEIAAGEAPCHKIWEDADHMAFLSIFPNTPGFSVVIPKRHVSSYLFDQEDEVVYLTSTTLAGQRQLFWPVGDNCRQAAEPAFLLPCCSA